MVYCFDAYELDPQTLELRRHGVAVHAELIVLRLLVCLVKNAGRLVSKNELVDEVWDGRAVADNAITVCVARLRKLLGHRRGSHEMLLTSYGRGYRFAAPVVLRETYGQTWAHTGQPERFDNPPLVGRTQELALLQRALEAASAHRGALVVLMGEPGIGKTSVAETFARELADSDVGVAWGYCREAGDTPALWPWQRLLAEIKAAAVPAGLGSAPPRLEAEDAFAGDSKSPARHRAFESILRELRSAAARRRWVLIIDDLHRADAASLELLHQLLDEIGHTRLLVIATLRQGLGRGPQRLSTHLPQLLGHRNCQRIALGRLHEPDVSTYVASLVEDPERRVSRAIFSKSEGNPFFMTELVRMIRDRAPSSPELPEIPTASLDLIRQRLVRLDPEVRQVLTTASVIGRSFELPLLAAVSGQDPSALMASLDDALEGEVLVAAPDSTSAFAFGHELLRSVLYDELTPQARRSLHVRVAGALEARADAGETVPVADLAYHYHAALPDGDLRKTVRACNSAALAAMAVFANTDVVRYARHALEALDLIEQPSLQMRMRLWYMIAIFTRGLTSPNRGAPVAEVARIARELGDGPMLVRAAVMYNLHPGLPPLPGANVALEDALTLLPETELGLRGLGLAALSCSVPHCFSAASSGELLARSEPLVREHGSPAAQYSSLLYKLYLCGGPSHEAEANATMTALEQLAQRHAEVGPVLPIDLGIQRAIAAWRRGDLETARAVMERAGARSQLLRHGELGWHCERFAALLRFATTTNDAALPALEALHSQAEEQSPLGKGIFGTRAFCALDRALGWGSPTPAQMDSLRGDLGFDPSDPPSLWAMKVRALASFGWLNEARALLFAVTPDQLSQLPDDRDRLGSLGHLTRAALLVDAPEHREALHALLEPHSGCISIGISFVCEGAVEHLLGLLTRARGDHARAEVYLRAGLSVHERAGLVRLAQESRAELARMNESARAP